MSEQDFICSFTDLVYNPPAKWWFAIHIASYDTIMVNWTGSYKGIVICIHIHNNGATNTAIYMVLWTKVHRINDFILYH